MECNLNGYDGGIRAAAARRCGAGELSIAVAEQGRNKSGLSLILRAGCVGNTALATEHR